MAYIGIHLVKLQHAAARAFSVMRTLWFCFMLSTVTPTAWRIFKGLHAIPKCATPVGLLVVIAEGKKGYLPSHAQEINVCDLQLFCKCYKQLPGGSEEIPPPKP